MPAESAPSPTPSHAQKPHALLTTLATAAALGALGAALPAHADAITEQEAHAT